MSSKLALVVLIAVALGVAGCSKAGGSQCSTGIYCPAGTQCAAKQAICIETPCGNGVIDPGEVCDDGGTIDGDVLDGKRCSADCKSDESCGNGIWDQKAGEACDKNDPAWAGHCSDDCKSTLSCGNHQVD